MARAETARAPRKTSTRAPLLLNSLSSRMSLAFMLLILATISALVAIWQTYRVTTFVHATASLLVSQVRTVRFVMDASHTDTETLERALASSGLNVLFDDPAPVGDDLHPAFVREIEQAATAQLGQTVRLEVRYLPPRSAWALFDWRGHHVTLYFPLDEWEAGLPSPILLWLSLVLVLAPVAAVFTMFWLQGPLKRVAEAIGKQGGKLCAVSVPAGATEEVATLVEAYNRVVAEVGLRDRERELILGGVSHDLKAPLARLRLRASFTDDEALADGIVRDVAALDRIAGQFLTFVRSGNDQGSPADALCTPRGVAEQIAASVRPRGEVAVVGPCFPVFCAAEKLERILANLVDNAFEYGQQPISIRLQREGEFARIGVADKGKGMTDDALQRALEPFARLDPSRGALGHCGLGLAIVVRLSQQAGGELYGRRHEEGGFEIGVMLKLAPDHLLRTSTSTVR